MSSNRASTIALQRQRHPRTLHPRLLKDRGWYVIVLMSKVVDGLIRLSADRTLRGAPARTEDRQLSGSMDSPQRTSFW
jgi:hypothetical protein